MASLLVATPIETEECWRLLRSAEFGRVAVTMGAMPVILPVFYVVVDESVVFHTTAGTKMRAATSQTVVAFEADQFDPDKDEGWSVLLQGVAREVTDAGELNRVRGLSMRRLSGRGRVERFVAVPAATISGRRIQAAVDDQP
jgi:nitroimidazol reductase NimA-like FMN-containing flavoprotein (pyridoxamine 5'-phosphate oxidase superfamily)